MMPDSAPERAPAAACPELAHSLRDSSQATGGQALSRDARVLSARAARTFYNVADAFVPPGSDGRPGAGDRDLWPAVERRLRHEGPPAARRTWAALALVEWLPVLDPRVRRGFSHLPLARRRALLERWERSRVGPLSRAVRALRERVRRALESAQSSDGA
jgi:hypothetical protein